MVKILISVQGLGPLIDVVECDLGRDVPVDAQSVLDRINGMIDEAVECVEDNDLIGQFEHLISEAEFSDDEMLYLAPELYLFKHVLIEIQRHPYTRRHPKRLRHVSMVGLLGDLMLHYH